jgi:hypothetical protein
MKRVCAMAVAVLMCILLSCGKDTDATLTRLTIVTQDKIQGTWKLRKSVEEYYEPMNTLVYRDEYDGGPGDSIVFRDNNILDAYEDGYPGDPETLEYRLGLNTIEIDEEEWKVTRLTDTELVLYIEEIEDGTKWWQQAVLYR